MTMAYRIVNCPFMANSYSSLNFDGPLRSDANADLNPRYVPNSFVSKFRPDTAETPYAVSDNIVSRKSHFYHECHDSEYDQARELYGRVMDEGARSNLHSNTAVLLKLVTFPEIQITYLAQLHNISPVYAQSVFDLLPEKDFTFDKIESAAKNAVSINKLEKFRPSKQGSLVGKVPEVPVYNV
jgi:catalase